MYIDVDGARLFFDTVGAQLAIAGDHMEIRETLIVMHGGPGFDHTTLRPFFDRFADRYQVVYLDHRGNGRSSGTRESWTLAQWGRDVQEFCDRLGISKPVVYGNSFGGMVAMSYATQFPGHPSRLILSSTAARLHISTTVALMRERGGERAGEVAARFWRRPDEQTMQEYMDVCLPLYNPSPNPEEAEARKRAIIRPEVTRHFILGEMRTMDVRADLARIACPTLILAGGYDPITPAVCSQEIQAALAPGIGELHVFPDAGHGVHRDDPVGAERVLRTFLSPSPE
jgi:pimeloyl-ACP methyl ester carboxylesterase